MSTSPNIAKPLYCVGSALLLAGCLFVTVISAGPGEWHPLALVLVLGALAVGAQRMVVTIRAQAINAAGLSLWLAMCLLGPGPAVAFGLAAMTYRSATSRLAAHEWLANFSTYAAYPLAGALLVRAVVGDVHDPHNAHAIQGFSFGAVVFAVCLITLVLDVFLIALHGKVFWGRTIRDQVEQLFVPLIPAELAAALLTALAALAYTNFGLGWSVAAVLVLVTFQVLAVRLIRAESVVEKLRTNVFALVSSQVGTIKAAVKTLDMRDPGSERHAAAVANYARELAQEVGCSEEEQYVVHTAGLAHDIGRLGLADRVLQVTSPVDEADWREIRRHPIEGAAWVGQIHGYSPVADVILAHHERWDGSGYPDQLIGPEIPTLSRILGICEAFDAMTGERTYRTRMTPHEAFEQLRNGAGTQFDPELVDTFIALRERTGGRLVVDDADFEAELDFERRVRMLAAPSAEQSSSGGRILERLGHLLAP
jgi:HD-GYP domain-containing protein (c-di-GMP phosphodiesterase class II)